MQHLAMYATEFMLPDIIVLIDRESTQRFCWDVKILELTKSISVLGV